MVYDSFGLPPENAALKEGEHPRKIVERNIERIRGQMKRMGWAIDWSRELSTHEPEYYRWTQWLFLKLFEAGHAYRTAAVVNWCPNDQTVRERTGEGRPLRTLRCGGRGAQARRVVLPHHGVRGPPARRDEGRGVAGARAGDAAKLDRQVGRRGNPLPGR